MAQNAYAAPQRPYPQPISHPAVSYNSTTSASSNQLAQQKPRPPKSRSFSFRSDRSSNKSHHVHLHETPEEKEARRLHSKADPTLAMSEAEPSAVAAGVKSSLAPLRSIQHRDALGNPITDPDRSNPTRNRWERPLDTIRSFEAAIDGAYNARRSYVRAGSSAPRRPKHQPSFYSDSATMRPRSYYPPRFPQESYYSNSRPGSYRPDSQFDPMRQRERDNYLDQSGPGAQHLSNVYQPGNRQRYGRMQSEPGPSNYNGQRLGESSVYPLPNNHRSYETVASGGSAASGSGSSGAEASGYTTDPTSGSENSSIDRRGSPGKRPEPTNDYGINFGQSYQPPAPTLSLSGANGPTGSAPYNPRAGSHYAVQPPQSSYAPAVPRKDLPVTHKPMQVSTPVAPELKPSPPEKRKSWFMRRFSKSS